MKLDDIIKNTPKYKVKRHFASLEIRTYLTEALEKAAVDGSFPETEWRSVICEDGFVTIKDLEKYLKYKASEREKT